MSSHSGRSGAAASRLPLCPVGGRITTSHRIDCSANVSLRDQRSGLCLPDSLPASGKESQRGALAYRKTCGYCHVEVGCGGTLHSEIHSTMTQAMHRTCEPQGRACGEAANGQGRGD